MSVGQNGSSQCDAVIILYTIRQYTKLEIRDRKMKRSQCEEQRVELATDASRSPREA